MAGHESADTHSVRAFNCFTDELQDMAERGSESRAVEVVTLEATLAHHIPVYEVLDRAGFEVHTGRCAGDEAGQRTQE